MNDPSSTPQFGTWTPYSGTQAIVLAVILLLVAAALAYLAFRMRSPLEIQRPGRAIAAFLLVLWVLSILTLAVCAGVEGAQALRDYPGYFNAVPVNPITPVTDTAVVLTFVVVLLLNLGRGFRAAFLGAIIGALAAPWIFELPYDLVVMGRTYPPLPPDPTLYRLLFFLPLFLVAVSTFAVLSLSPLVRLSRYTLSALAGMFVAFALWAVLFGFEYPGSAGPIVLNDVGKILAFVAAVTLFVPAGWHLSRATFRSRADPNSIRPDGWGM
jgi:hypothetical protein